MEEIHISAATAVVLGISAVLTIIGPFLAWFIWRKKTNAAWIPLIAGVLGYLVIGTVRGLTRALLLTDMQDTPWLYYILQAVLAGVFEEGGRYIIFRWCIPNKDQYRDAVSYGIGHGGLEHVIVSNGFLLLYGFLVALFYVTGGMESLAPGGAGYFLMDGQDAEGTLEIVRSVADTDLVSKLLTLPECFQIGHCCLSVLVFTAVHYDVNLKWLWAAIGVHTIMDIIPAFHFAGDLSMTEMSVLYLLFEIGVLYLTWRVWKHYRQSWEIPESSLS